MLLVNSRYTNQFDFDKNLNYLFIVENSKEFSILSTEFYHESNGNSNSEFVLSDNNAIISFEKISLFLYDFISFEINSKKVVNEINNRILKILSQEDYVEDIYELNKNFININDKLLETLNFPLTYDMEFNYEKFVKLSNYKIDENGNLLDKIVTYIQFFSKIKKLKLVVFVSIFNYLSLDEINLLTKQLNYQEICCLFLERNDINECQLNNFGKIIIDKDLCEI